MGKAQLDLVQQREHSFYRRTQASRFAIEESEMFFPPFLVFFLFICVFLLLLVFSFVQLGVFALAFRNLGIAPEMLFSLLFLCIVGSMINIPIRRIPMSYQPEEWETVSFFGMRFRPPRWQQRHMVLAVNVGGAIIPTMLSIYLWNQTGTPVRMLIAVAIETFIVYKLAKPVPGVGIATPMFVPPLVAALIAYLVNPQWPAPTAYVAGTLGTLIGADLLKLNQIKQLNAPVASIGGAGTFDGIFLTGILAVLLS
jgi:uncharacterized membrane protein